MESGPPQFGTAPPPNDLDHSNPRPRKRRRRNIVPEPQPPPDAASVLSEEVVSGLLNRSVAVVLQSVGFTGAVACAQAELLQMAEEYYIHMLKSVTRFAHAHRRTRPTVNDFEDLMPELNITPSDLVAEVKRLPRPQKTSFPLPPPTPPPEPEPDLSTLLGPELDGSKEKRARLYSHLPPFPSKHTYTSTPVFAERPTEPRMIREKATAEARLAEQALRKLLAVSSKKEAQAGAGQGDGNLAADRGRQERDTEWERAFADLSGKPKPNGIGVAATPKVGVSSSNTPTPSPAEEGFLEVVVNSDSRYWRKGKHLGQQRQAATAL